MNSLVIPVYRNEENIPDLLAELERLAGLPGVAPLEVIFVVDGSPDHSLARLQEGLPASGFQAKVVDLARNFGSFSAIRAGLAEAVGTAIAVLSADGQEPVELAAEFFAALRSGRCDLALGTRTARHDPWKDRLAAGIFWGLFRRLVISELPPGGVDVFGCTDEVRHELLRLEESNSSLIGLLFWVGYRRETLPYVRQARKRGKSAWSFARKLHYLLDCSFSFSDLPVRMLLFGGGIGIALSAIYSMIVMGARLTGWIQLPGYSTTVLLICLFGSFQLFSMGILGSYLWRTFENTKRRPGYLVRRRTAYNER